MDECVQQLVNLLVTRVSQYTPTHDARSAIVLVLVIVIFVSVLISTYSVQGTTCWLLYSEAESQLI